MPVHDWARVDANVFHHFHQRWTIAICDALNAGLLPSGYSALVEQHAGGLVPDVLALERRFRPSGFAEHSGGIVTATPPKTRLVRQAKVVLAAPRTASSSATAWARSSASWKSFHLETRAAARRFALSWKKQSSFFGKGSICS